MTGCWLIPIARLVGNFQVMLRTDEQSETYRHFVKERLEVDYESVVKDMNTIVDEVREYETLQLAVGKIKVSCTVID